ncbi:MAG TPA: polysaccharide pyruvyl transferase family protein [Vampirovibrionales bacterium]
MHKKRFTLVGYYGAGNLGDELLLASFIKQLVKNVNNSSIQVLSSRPSSHNVQLKSIVSSEQTILCRNKFDAFQVLQSLWTTDYLVFAGGSIFQDKSSFFSLAYYFSVALLAKCLFKKVWFIGQGIGPLTSTLSTFLAFIAFKYFGNHVSVRDEKSYNLLSSWKLSKIQLIPDLAWCFLNKAEHLQINKESKNFVLISLRSGYFSTEALRELASFLNNNFSKQSVALLAFEESDNYLLNKLRPQLKHQSIELCLLTSLQALEEFKHIFEHASFAIMSRFHALLIAINFAIPSIALSYDPKVSSLASSMRVPYINCSEFKESIVKDLLVLTKSEQALNINNLSMNLDEYFSGLFNELHLEK